MTVCQLLVRDTPTLNRRKSNQGSSYSRRAVETLYQSQQNGVRGEVQGGELRSIAAGFRRILGECVCDFGRASPRGRNAGPAPRSCKSTKIRHQHMVCSPAGISFHEPPLPLVPSFPSRSWPGVLAQPSGQVSPPFALALQLVTTASRPQPARLLLSLDSLPSSMIVYSGSQPEPSSSPSQICTAQSRQRRSISAAPRGQARPHRQAKRIARIRAPRKPPSDLICCCARLSWAQPSNCSHGRHVAIPEL